MNGQRAMTGAERARRHRTLNPDKAYATRRKYRHNNSKWQTDESYLSREFVAWDGEGITDATGKHRYVMLAVKSGNGDGDYLADPKGLGTARVFDFVLAGAERNVGSVHVIYGGGYDFNMWMRDFTESELTAVYKRKFYVWHGYRIAWRQGKSFYLSRVDAFGNKQGSGVTIYDVVSFFQCPFVKACDDYLGERFAHREMIVENKALRSSFTEADIPQVRVYNDAELENLLMLMRELRERLNRVGLRPRRWDGPGAVASALLLREKVKEAQKECPPEVMQAARFAYAGGRFEVIKFGHVNRKAYEYDVNSAYPSALREVPNLAMGYWQHHDSDPGRLPFALYHVSSKAYRSDIPAPLFRRDANGTICYPQQVTGWYWSPEVEALRAYCDAGYGEYHIREVWEFHGTTDTKPFAFIEPLYNKRRALKRAGDGAHVGIKLALNSLYGKLAQQVGWERKPDGTLRIPPFHQLEWAGFVTSHCRAAVLSACLSTLDSVVAFETDAVFSDTPLNVPCGTNLGEFEVTEFSDLTYVQSGLYFGTKTNGEIVSKTRGVDRGTLTRPEVLTKMSSPKAEDRYVAASLTRFIGAGVALSQSFKRWQKWETITKNMTLEPTGKRIHVECSACRNGSIAKGEWHETMCPMMNDAHSCEFPIEWVNPDPAMTELEEMRREVEDYDGFTD